MPYFSDDILTSSDFLQLLWREGFTGEFSIDVTVHSFIHCPFSVAAVIQTAATIQVRT